MPSRIIQSLFPNKYKIVILLGVKRSKIFVIKNSKIINKQLIKHSQWEDSYFISSLISKYKGSKTYILFGCDKINLSHETLAVINNSMQTSLIENYIINNIPKENLTSYHVVRSTSDNLSVIFASTPFEDIHSLITERILENKLVFGGIFLLPSEFERISDKIINKFNHQYKENDIQIIVSLSEIYGIIITIKNDKHIIDVLNHDIIDNKSEKYISGSIETIINDSIISLKKYADNNNLSISVITLLGEKLYNLINLNSINDASVKNLNLESKFSDKIIDNSHIGFLDDIIALNFLNIQKFKAFNRIIRNLNILTNINNFIFIPLAALVLLFSLKTFFLQKNIFESKRKLHNIQKDYFDHAGEYRKLKSDFPREKNFDKIVDYYTLEKLLKDSRFISPFEKISKSITETRTSEIDIKNISWQIINPPQKGMPKKSQTIISLSYTKKDVNIAKLLSDFEVYVSNIKLIFENSIVTVNRSDDISSYGDSMTIEAIFTITDN